MQQSRNTHLITVFKLWGEYSSHIGPVETLLNLISVIPTAENVATVRRFRPSREESEQQKFAGNQQMHVLATSRQTQVGRLQLHPVRSIKFAYKSRTSKHFPNVSQLSIVPCAILTCNVSKYQWICFTNGQILIPRNYFGNLGSSIIRAEERPWDL